MKKRACMYVSSINISEMLLSLSGTAGTGGLFTTQTPVYLNCKLVGAISVSLASVSYSGPDRAVSRVTAATVLPV